MIAKAQRQKIGVCVACALLVLSATCWIALHSVALPKRLFEPQAASIEFLDRNGRPLRQVAAGIGYAGGPQTFAELPKSLVNATVAAEDRRFWTHSGVDWRATLRAGWALIRNRRIISGGSTITQQLIKLTEPRPRTIATKFIEMAQAMRLEQLWTKEQILTAYFNRLDYGNLTIGPAAACQFYFGKPLCDLSAAEAALLAGLPQSPTRLNPHRAFERAKKRQEWVLEQMARSLKSDEYRRVQLEPVQLRPPHRAFLAPHFIDLLWQLHPDDFAAGGRIHSTLDLELNQRVEALLRMQVGSLRGQHVRNGAAVVIENRTGSVLALVGSENYFSPAAGQVNGTWAPRSAGSTLKPFTYLLSFENGATPASIVADVRTEFPTPTGVFAPINYNGRFHGPMRYRAALANSLNVSAVKVLASLDKRSNEQSSVNNGVAFLQERLRSCGLTTLTNSPEFYGLGLAIGNAEVRLLELANAYACLARLGEYRPYRLWSDSPRSARRLFDSAASYLVADILSDNDARAMAFGIDSDLRFDFPVACKTGTSSDFRDNWAIGYTPEFTVGIWMGNFDGTPMSGVSGVSGAAPVLHAAFEHLHERYGTSWYAQPETIVERLIHPVTGKLVADAQGREFILEKFIRGVLPPNETLSDYDPDGPIRLPSDYGPWLASADNWLANRAVVDSSSVQSGSRIASPLAGSTWFLNPDLPSTSRRIPLKCSHPGENRWSSDSLEIETEANRAYAVMKEGRHQIFLHDTKTAGRTKTWIVVKEL